IDELQGYDSEALVLSPVETDDVDDESGIDETPETRSARYVRRRLVLVAPAALAPGDTAALRVGFAEAYADEQMQTPINVLLRLSVINGTVRSAREVSFELDSAPMQQSFEIAAERFTA